MVKSKKRSHKASRRKKYRLRRAGYILGACARPECEEAPIQSAVLEKIEKHYHREVENLKKRLLRTRADLDNFRKRTTRDRQELVKFANETLLATLLPVLDNFSHALKAADTTTDFASLKKGIKLIHQQMLKILQESGLVKIDASHQPFDPHFHEAMATNYMEDIPENRILEILRDGYTLKGRVLRPAMVRVNKKPPEAEVASHTALKPNPNIKPEPLNTPDPTQTDAIETNS